MQVLIRDRKNFHMPKKYQILAWICHKAAYIHDRDACYDASKLIWWSYKKYMIPCMHTEVARDHTECILENTIFCIHLQSPFRG